MSPAFTITVRGDTMHLHFDGPPQIRAGLNMTYTALLKSDSLLRGQSGGGSDHSCRTPASARPLRL